MWPPNKMGGSQYEPEQNKEKESAKEKEVSGRGGASPALAGSSYRLEDAARACYSNQ